MLCLQKKILQEGHVVDHFDDGKDALIAAMGQEYDVLILDRMVPGLDGLAVLTMIVIASNLHELPSLETLQPQYSSHLLTRER